MITCRVPCQQFFLQRLPHSFAWTLRPFQLASRPASHCEMQPPCLQLATDRCSAPRALYMPLQEGDTFLSQREAQGTSHFWTLLDVKVKEDLNMSTTIAIYFKHNLTTSYF